MMSLFVYTMPSSYNGFGLKANRGISGLERDMLVHVDKPFSGLQCDQTLHDIVLLA